MSELGLALKTARETKEMTLDDLQDITKIQKKYLLALENGEFGQLPGDFYTRAFIKNYAEAVGLDSQAFFEEHAGEIPKPKHEPVESAIVPSRATSHRRNKKPVRRPKAQTAGTSSIMPKLLIIALIIIVLVAIWLIALYVTGNKSDSSTAPASQSDVSYKKDDTQKASDNTKKSKKDSGQSANKSDQSKKTDSTKKTDETKKTMSLTKDKTSGSTSYYTLANADAFKVKISSSTGNDSWISAIDASSNKKYAFGSVNDKTSFNFDASDSNKISIKVGSVPNTKITINGKAFKFPSSQITQKIYITYKK